MVVSRVASQFVCGLGMMQLFFAIGLTICGFVVMGMYQTLQCLGIWYGLPMMIPALSSIVVMATRHKAAAFTVLTTSVVMIAVGAYHLVAVHDDISFWEKYKGYAESNATPRSCAQHTGECLCSDSDDYRDAGYRVTSCDLFRTGEELFWTLFGLGVGAMASCLLNGMAALWAFTSNVPEIPPENEQRGPPEYELAGDKYKYPMRK